MRLLLASKSPRRRQLLGDLGYPVEFISLFRHYTGCSFIGKDFDKLPFRIALNFVGIITYLRFITCKLFLIIRTNTAVCSYSQSSLLGFLFYKVFISREDYNLHWR